MEPFTAVLYTGLCFSPSDLQVVLVLFNRYMSSFCSCLVLIPQLLNFTLSLLTIITFCMHFLLLTSELSLLYIRVLKRCSAGIPFNQRRGQSEQTGLPHLSRTS